MKKSYSKTKNKIQELWNAVSEIEGILLDHGLTTDSLKNNTEQIWKELNRPKTFIPDVKFIDVKHQCLIEFDSEGKAALDTNGNQKISSLLSADGTKTAVVWDETARVWRFYAVYAPGL